MPSIYEMRQPKEKVDWRDIVDLLEKGFSVYAGLKQLGLAGEQEKRLGEQGAADLLMREKESALREKDYGLREQAAAREGQEFTMGLAPEDQRWTPAGEGPDMPGMLSAEGPYGRFQTVPVPTPETTYRKPMPGLIEVLTGDKVDVMTDPTYQRPEPAPNPMEEWHDIIRTPGIAVEGQQAQAERAKWDKFMGQSTLPSGAIPSPKPGMYYDPNLAARQQANAAGLRTEATVGARTGGEPAPMSPSDAQAYMKIARQNLTPPPGLVGDDLATWELNAGRDLVMGAGAGPSGLASAAGGTTAPSATGQDIRAVVAKYIDPATVPASAWPDLESRYRRLGEAGLAEFLLK